MHSLLNEHDSTAILKGVQLFSDLANNNEALKIISGIMKKKNYSEKHKLTEQDLEGHEYFILTKGTVSIYKNTPEKDKYKVAVLKGENLPSFGEGALMEGEHRSATIICDTHVECLVLDRKDFNEFCQTHPQYALPIFRRVAISIMNRLNQTSHDLMLLHKALMEEIRSS